MTAERCPRCDDPACDCAAAAAAYTDSWAGALSDAVANREALLDRWHRAGEECLARLVDRAKVAEAILADIRGEIVTLTGHRDSRSRGGQHVGTGGRLSSAPPGVERVLREWLAKIDGAMPPAPPLPGPTAEDFAHHARVSQKGANAVRWQANVEPLIEAVRAAASVAARSYIHGDDAITEGQELIEAVEALLAATKEADRG